MTSEEIQLKLGLDASQFATGLRSMQTETQAAGAHTEKTFLHAKSAARGFHQVLEQLNETIPGLGTAFTALANPMTAAFIAGASAIHFVREKLKEFNAEMDKQGEAAAKPIWSREQMIALRNEIADAHKEYRDFLKTLHPSQVEATVEAIAGEKDPNVRNRQAYIAQKRLSEERDNALARMKQLDLESDLLISEKRKLPAALEATKKFAEEEKKRPIFKTFTSIDPSGRAHEFQTNERDVELEERREAVLDSVIRRMEERREKNAELIRERSESRKEMERGISDRQKAIGELGKIQADVLWPEWVDEGSQSIRSGSASFKSRIDLESMPRGTGNAAENTKSLGKLLQLHEEWDKNGLTVNPKNGQ